MMPGPHCPEPLRIAGPETRSRGEGLWFAHSHTEPRQAPRPAPGPMRLVGAHPSPRAGPCSRPVFTVISGPGLVLLSLEMTEPLGQTRKGPRPRGLQTRPSPATSAFPWALAPCSVSAAPPRAGPSQTPPSRAGAMCPSQHSADVGRKPHPAAASEQGRGSWLGAESESRGSRGPETGDGDPRGRIIPPPLLLLSPAFHQGSCPHGELLQPNCRTGLGAHGAAEGPSSHRTLGARAAMPEAARHFSLFQKSGGTLLRYAQADLRTRRSSLTSGDLGPCDTALAWGLRSLHGVRTFQGDRTEL